MHTYNCPPLHQQKDRRFFSILTYIIWLVLKWKVMRFNIVIVHQFMKSTLCMLVKFSTGSCSVVTQTTTTCICIVTMMLSITLKDTYHWGYKKHDAISIKHVPSQDEEIAFCFLLYKWKFCLIRHQINHSYIYLLCLDWLMSNQDGAVVAERSCSTSKGL